MLASFSSTPQYHCLPISKDRHQLNVHHRQLFSVNMLVALLNILGGCLQIRKKALLFLKLMESSSSSVCYSVRQIWKQPLTLSLVSLHFVSVSKKTGKKNVYPTNRVKKKMDDQDLMTRDRKQDIQCTNIALERSVVRVVECHKKCHKSVMFTTSNLFSPINTA